jgi:hypothetical protein
MPDQVGIGFKPVQSIDAFRAGFPSRVRRTPKTARRASGACSTATISPRDPNRQGQKKGQQEASTHKIVGSHQGGKIKMALPAKDESENLRGCQAQPSNRLAKNPSLHP